MLKAAKQTAIASEVVTDFMVLLAAERSVERKVILTPSAALPASGREQNRGWPSLTALDLPNCIPPHPFCSISATVPTI
jgi:hypothetical protein